MKILNFSIRDSLIKDGTMEMKVHSTQNKYMNAAFSSIRNDIINPYTYKRYYLHPYIQISNLCYKVISRTKDTSKIFFIKAKSTVIHELTHYLQTVDDINYIEATADNVNEYVAQEVEFEAHGVSAYYFFEKTDNKKLKSIMLSNKSIRIKISCL